VKLEALSLKLGKLNEKCPKRGSKDKTLKRNLDAEHRAFGSTQSLACSECGYVFKSAEYEEKRGK
jgi:Cys-rich peptide (TIGR04165 family)